MTTLAKKEKKRKEKTPDIVYYPYTSVVVTTKYIGGFCCKQLIVLDTGVSIYFLFASSASINLFIIMFAISADGIRQKIITTESSLQQIVSINYAALFWKTSIELVLERNPDWLWRYWHSSFLLLLLCFLFDFQYHKCA
jgi:hypothetical protein